MAIIQTIINFFVNIFAYDTDFTAAQSDAMGGFFVIILGAVAIGVFALVIKLVSRIKSLAFI